jgi:hypothetical protein
VALPQTVRAEDAPNATRPVAAWDVVPYQILDKPFNVGVVAFHETGCKVEFTISAKGATDVTATADNPTLNPRTNVWEFWTAIDPAKFPDGPIEVKAKVIPLDPKMITRELDPLPLYANAKGSLKFPEPLWLDGDKGDDSAAGTEAAPLKTLAGAIKKATDGQTIYLKASKSYSANKLDGGLKRNYWTTITAAPGVKQEDVEIGPGRPGTDKLLFKNVTLYSNPEKRGYNTILGGEQGRSIVWLDNCKCYNKKGRWEGGGNTFGNRYVPYITGGITTEMNDGPGAVLMRDHKIIKITSDAFTGADVAINCSVDDINPGKTGAHPDFHQSYAPDPNKPNTVILYNVRGTNCISQGFFGHNLKDSAFVNCLFVKGDTVMVSQYSGPLDHVLFLHITLPNQTWLWRDGFKATNDFMLDCIFTSMSDTKGADTTSLTRDYNHFIKSDKKFGEHVTEGDPNFVDPAAFDFHLRPDSPAAGSAEPLQCVPADIDGKPYGNKPNKGCFATK